MYKSNMISQNDERPNISNDEDYFLLYQSNESYIYYVRNYAAQQEFICMTSDLLVQLPENWRPLSNVVVKHNFFILRHFEPLIKEYSLAAGQLSHFEHLFDVSMSEFFNSL